jgi:hypothetical protein
MNKNKYIFFFALLIIACSKSDNNDADLKYLNFNEISIEESKESSPRGISLTPKISISFSEPIDRNSIEQSISITTMGVENTKFESTLSNGDSVINISFTNALTHLTKYNLTVNQTLKSKRNRILFSEINYDFTTQFDPTPINFRPLLMKLYLPKYKSKPLNISGTLDTLFLVWLESGILQEIWLLQEVQDLV